ncbi:unnamed protein product [Rotaria sp. Silwood2]|nr:unnamed protein product [Rotaria sp. Silwood2]
MGAGNRTGKIAINQILNKWFNPQWINIKIFLIRIQHQNFYENQKTTVIVYDQPKVVIVRRYTRTIVPSVDPDQYKKQYDDVLLDAPTLMKWIRCLKIEENMINLPPVE